MSDFTFTGHERSDRVAEQIAELIRSGADALGFEGIWDLDVVNGFQPYITIRLETGAEFQLTPVLSRQPRYDGVNRCDECGQVLTDRENEDGDSICGGCWRPYAERHNLDPLTGDPL
jgi:hypothetical protein